MKSLVCLGLPAPPCSERASSWIERSPSLHLIDTLQGNRHSPNKQLSRRRNKFQARAKGFGEAITISQKKRGQEADSSNKSSGNNEDDDQIPQVVFERMITRILFFVGMPMISGVGLLYLLGVLKEQGVWDVPLWFPFLTTLLAFGTSALGIAYGTLSTSWNVGKKGSLLGWEEAQQNWPELWREEESQR